MKQTSRVDPAYFIRSFLVVAFHFVLLFAVLLMSLLVVSYFAFPETYELWKTDDTEVFNKALRDSPEKLFPVGLCVALCVIDVIASLIIGLQTAWLAPFSKFGHGAFLAVVFALTFCQFIFATEFVPRGMMVFMMLATPAAVLIGARKGDQWFGDYDDDEATEPTETDESQEDQTAAN